MVPVDEDGPLRAVSNDACQVNGRAAVHVDLWCVQNPRPGHCWEGGAGVAWKGGEGVGEV